MFRRLIENLFLKRRYFWRYANFDEISKLYIARTLRYFALRLVAVFVVIYLFNLDYSLAFIFSYLAIYHLVKIPMIYLAAMLTLKIGARHTTFYANILYIPTMLALTFLKGPGSLASLYILAGIILVQGLSVAMYDYSSAVNFARAKSAKGVGKQLGYFQILEKIASILAPIAGGLVATILGPQSLMYVASIILGLSALPLIRTAEPINKRQKIRWRRYPWKKTWDSLRAQGAAGVDIIASGTGWQLYLAALVFAHNQEIYAIVGVLTSISTVAAFISAFAFGRLIDRSKGGALLKWGVYLKALINFSRPLVQTPVAAATTSALAETSSTAYSMAFMRGTYDLADYSGYRLNYLMLMAMAADAGAVIAAGFAALFFLTANTHSAFATFFVLSAFVTFMVAKPNFPLYKKK